MTRYAAAAGVPIVAELPRSDVLREAESIGQTVIQAVPNSSEAQIFRGLAAALADGRLSTHLPSPLDDEALECLLRGDRLVSEDHASGRLYADASGRSDGAASPAGLQADVLPQADPVNAEPETVTEVGVGSKSGHTRFASKSLLAKEPLHGCAFAGAVATLAQIRDAATVAHGPRSCAHIAASSLLSAGLGTRARYGTAVPEQLDPVIVATDLGEHAMIRGGLDDLRAALNQAQAGRRAVFVVTTCPSGVIGDDVDRAIAEQRRAEDCRRPHGSAAPTIRITTDGNLDGDYLQGIINACIEGAGALIDPDCSPEDDLVNVVAEKNIALNADANLAAAADLLASIGVRVNCRFVRHTDVAELRGFLRAPLNLPAYVDHLGRVLMQWLTERFGCVFAAQPFPSGFHETERWLREIAASFGREAKAEIALERCREEYETAMAAVRPMLAGRRLMITSYIHDIDWILETAFDAGMDVVRVGIIDYSQDSVYRTRHADRVRAETGYDPDRRSDDIRDLCPDLVVGNYQSPGLPETAHYDTVPMCPDVGYPGGAQLALRWVRLLQAPLVEGWRRDEARLLRVKPALPHGGVAGRG